MSTAIKTEEQTVYTMDLKVGTGTGLKGYQEGSDTGALAGRELRNPYSQSEVYVVNALYVLETDEVTFAFNSMPDNAEIKLTFRFPDECQADEVLTLTKGSFWYEGSSSTLYDLFTQYGSADVLVELI